MSAPWDADAQKRAVGEAGAALVEPGMVVGLGTGTTAAFLVRALGARARAERLALRCTATSKATAALAAEVGLAVLDLDAVGAVDLTLDGADEVGPGLALIKGGGAALLREKLVWEASRRCVVMADASKRVAALGAFPLSVEVVAFGHRGTAGRIRAALERLGYAAAPRLREAAGAPVVTDNGGLLYDLPLGRIDDPPALAHALKATTGVMEHGLFLGLAAQALIAGEHGGVRLAPAAGDPQVEGATREPT